MRFVLVCKCVISSERSNKIRHVVTRVLGQPASQPHWCIETALLLLAARTIVTVNSERFYEHLYHVSYVPAVMAICSPFALTYIMIVKPHKHTHLYFYTSTASTAGPLLSPDCRALRRIKHVRNLNERFKTRGGECSSMLLTFLSELQVVPFEDLNHVRIAYS